jgi:hypothetical protein
MLLPATHPSSGAAPAERPAGSAEVALRQASAGLKLVVASRRSLSGHSVWRRFHAEWVPDVS